MMADAPGPMPRRNWLLHGLQASIAATLAAILYPVIRFVRPRAATNSGALEVVAPYRVNTTATPWATNNMPSGGQACMAGR